MDTGDGAPVKSVGDESGTKEAIKAKRFRDMVETIQYLRATGDLLLKRNAKGRAGAGGAIGIPFHDLKELKAEFLSESQELKSITGESSFGFTQSQKLLQPQDWDRHQGQGQQQQWPQGETSKAQENPTIEDRSPIFKLSSASKQRQNTKGKQANISNPKESTNATDGISEECLDCLLYCSLFPNHYEIDKDTLAQLWLATGLINEEPMEGIAGAYLEALQHVGCISVISKENQQGNEKVWYQFNDFTFSEEMLLTNRLGLLRVGGSEATIAELSEKSDQTRHVAVSSGLQADVDDHLMEVFTRFAELRTFVFLRGHESHIERVPYDFFPALQHLQAVDLSGTDISELPISIGNAKCLRYLDLSETLIKQLPETTDRLQNLQTLKLQNCSCLLMLPKRMRKLTSLRHLSLAGSCRLQSMPPGIGDLTSLLTLSEFLVGRDNGYLVGELKSMNKLKGKLNLSRLENVASVDEAKEANLSNKCLTKLELQWSDKRGRRANNMEVDNGVIEHLKPNMNLQELRIVCYRGSMFPSWLSDPSFLNLVNITLYKCVNSRLLPGLGKLRSLKSLCLNELTGVKTIDFHFYGDDDMVFPKLEKLVIKSMPNLEGWRDMGKCKLVRLLSLTVKDCPKLAALGGICSTPRLEYLEVTRCPVIPCLPEGYSPASLKTLVIDGCPLLSLRLSKDIGKDWPKIAHIPYLFMDLQIVDSS